MAAFDAYLKKVTEYTEEMRGNGRQVREIDCPAELDKLVEGLPVKVGPQASSGLILRGDTYVEMGSPEAGSCAFLLYTNNASLIRDGKITLIGPDIPESSAASLPFAQIMLVGGANLGDVEYEAMDQLQYISDQVEGYMVRSGFQRMWSRVSKDAVAKGFNFETLGRALMTIFKSEEPKVQAVEVVFITSSKEDFVPLADMMAEVQVIGKDITTQNWKAKGIDLADCTVGVDCGSCGDQGVCDDIRKVTKARKKKVSKKKITAKS